MELIANLKLSLNQEVGALATTPFSHCVAKIQEKNKIITWEQIKERGKWLLKGIHLVLSQINLLCINNGFIFSLTYSKKNI
jgi:hypothetical protein